MIFLGLGRRSLAWQVAAVQLLVEASPYDTLWGVGLVANDPRIGDEKNWRGENWLGQVLTRMREDLAAEPDMGVHRKPRI